MGGVVDNPRPARLDPVTFPTVPVPPAAPATPGSPCLTLRAGPVPGTAPPPGPGLLLALDPALPAWAVEGSPARPEDPPARALRLGPGWAEAGDRPAPLALVQAWTEALLQHRPARLHLEGWHGAQAELLRLALAFELPVTLDAAAEAGLREGPRAASPAARRWQDGLRALWQDAAAANASQATAPPWSRPGFDYGLYALAQRDHALLQAQQAGPLGPLKACRRVLDVGSGSGIALDLLAREGVAGEGLEPDRASARHARSLGLAVHEAPAPRWLAETAERYDGLHCSHVVEHLRIEAVQALLAGCARVLEPGGLAVFTFPDPESIRSQLLGFWRDPEHVRFYHPALIESMARVQGLRCVYSNQRADGRTVGPFAMQPPALPPLPPADAPGLLGRLRRRLGLAGRSELAALEARLAWQQGLIERLWAVNQTWAWDDNAVLVLRKEAGA